jgi:shikimate kinase
MIIDKKIFLLGFMGSGKSTLGKKIANHLHVSFFDLDNEIENEEKSTVAQIFEKEGEEYFRLIEQKVLTQLINEEAVSVIALGGGTPCFYDNMKLINQSGTSIYIKYNSGILCSRLINAKITRPLIKGKSEQELKNYIENTLTQREVFYKQSKFIVEANNIKVEDVVGLLIPLK